ncbi:hypothetical protein [Nocardia asiatica]|uniref:hypothetical protein n=1 Tax=Nocardia asiatica TaxID=209252 RepID=UPI00030E5016|nr:hypothetical protein [Nocardia asiatica]
MTTELNQDPEHWRSLRDANHGVAPVFREQAKSDPAYVADFFSSKGYAANAFLEGLVKPYLGAREAGWTSVADGRQSIGDTSHSTASVIEDADVEGSVSVRWVSPEA